MNLMGLHYKLAGEFFDNGINFKSKDTTFLVMGRSYKFKIYYLDVLTIKMFVEWFYK